MARVLSTRLAVVLLVGLSLSLAACKKSVAVQPPPPPPPAAPAAPAPAITLRADRSTIDRGQNLVLTWEARNAASVRIEPGLGEVNSNGGNQQVSPASSVTYTATATGPGGSASDVARITVNIPAAPAAVNDTPRPAPNLTIEEIFNQKMQAILFDYDQSEIRPDQISKLQGNAAFLKQETNVRFTIEGHADERGSQEYNLGLGDRRANAVKQYLAGQGIADSRMNVVSFGEERPDCRDTTEECYARNRRAAFTLTR